MRLLVPLIFGLVGAGILASLGTWQVQRLGQKQAYLARIEAQLAEAPVALPATPDPAVDQFRAVRVQATITGVPIRVLTSRKNYGPGYRLIAPATEDDRAFLVDLGFVQDGRFAGLEPLPSQIAVDGNLMWPDETDSFTPPPDTGQGLWFARDIAAMSAALDTSPTLIVARKTTPAVKDVSPMPVTTDGIPNDHLEYAITWFLLCAAWLGMTAYWLWRIRRRDTI